MHFLDWEHVTKEFDGSRALASLSLSVERGEILGVLGPSGSGKSTLLRVTAGLEQATYCSATKSLTKSARSPIGT